MSRATAAAWIPRPPAPWITTLPPKARPAFPSPKITCERAQFTGATISSGSASGTRKRSEEHTSELQSHSDLVCRLLLEKKKDNQKNRSTESIVNSTKLIYEASPSIQLSNQKATNSLRVRMSDIALASYQSSDRVSVTDT